MDFLREIAVDQTFCLELTLSPALVAKVDSLIQQVEQGKGLVKSGKQIVELLRAEGLVQKLTLPPKCVRLIPTIGTDSASVPSRFTRCFQTC